MIIDAGGDPWAINDSLQAGRPAQISDLAQAFHDAGQSTTESNAAFEEARRRFAASWNRENGEHPINDSAEVQRVTKSLGLQAAQLPKIAVDLENIAAALAEAQRESGWYISALEQDLGRYRRRNRRGTSTTTTKDDANDLYEDAIERDQAVLDQVTQIRDGYSAALQNSLADLRADGGDPAEIKGADELLIPPPDTNPEQVHTLVEFAQRGAETSADRSAPAGDGQPQRNSGRRAWTRQRGRDERRPEPGRGCRGTVRAVAQALRDNALHDVNNDVFTNPEKYGLTATDITRYQNAVKTNKGLDHDRGDPKNPRP